MMENPMNMDDLGKPPYVNFIPGTYLSVYQPTIVSIVPWAPGLRRRRHHHQPTNAGSGEKKHVG